MGGLRAHRGVRRLAVLAAVMVTTVVVPGIGTSSQAATSGSIDLVGHGWGHGRGMGQYGALGYALDHGWDWNRILAHYYGGTLAGSVSNSTVTVELRAQTGQALTVVQERGELLTSADDGLPGGRVPHPAIRIERAGVGQFRVLDGPDCDGPWTARPALVGAASIEVLPVAGPTEDRTRMLALCEASGVRWLRGNLRAVEANGTINTVNALPLEGYLRGVVPRESPASWGSLGAGKGMQALLAQAVAARSYAAAESRSSWAKTCDTTSCQVYKGVAQQTGATFTQLEQPNTDSAVALTAGVVRLLNGAVARTEFSSSTGGYSAGGTFPAVVDAGDDISLNPNHTWTASIAVATVENTYGKGGLLGVDILTRNGLGAEGGRVLTMRLRFTGGDVSLSGDQFRSAFGLRSNWFTVANLGPADAKQEPAGGYLLRPDGALAPFGAAPAATGTTTTGAGMARAVATGGPSGRAGYVLDAYGALRPFNGAPAVTGNATWTFDAARDVVLRADGKSGYVLDLFGAVHAFGGAPGATVSRYTPGEGTARRLVLRADGASGWVLRADGSVDPFGAAPGVVTSPLPAGRSAVGLVAAPNGTSGQVVDNVGVWHPFSTGTMPAAVASLLGDTVAADGRQDGRSGYLASAGGTVAAVGGATAATGPALAATVDLALVAEPVGYVLDGYGGLHPLGGAPRAVSASYWPGWDIARRVAVRADGAGYVLDAWGGLHPFGVEGVAKPAKPTGGPYWPGWSIARDVVLLPGNPGAGYVLDGFGGIHAFGGAPAARSTGYWRGWDIARRLVLNPAGTGGYVLDGFGGLHRFAVGTNPLPLAIVGGPYWSGWDIARDVVLTGATDGYVIDGFGGVHDFGAAIGAGSWYWGGHDLVAGAATDGAARGWVVYADRWGRLHSAPGSAPAVKATATWVQFPIARDVALRPR